MKKEGKGMHNANSFHKYNINSLFKISNEMQLIYMCNDNDTDTLIILLELQNIYLS